LRDLKIRFTGLKDQIALQVMPIFLKLVNNIFKWFINNKSSLFKSIKVIGEVFDEIITSISRALGLLGEFLKKITNSETTLKPLLVFLGALWLKLNPLRLLLAGIVLILDEIAVWKAGGESMFGDLFSWISKTYDKTVALLDKLGIIGKYIKYVIGGAVAGGSLLSFVPGVGTATGAALGGVVGGAAALYQDVFKPMSEGTQNSFKLAPQMSTSPASNIYNNNITIDLNSSGYTKQDAMTLSKEINQSMMNFGNGVK